MAHSSRIVARALIVVAVSFPALAYADTPTRPPEAPPAMTAVSTARADHVDTGLYEAAVTAWTDAYARTVWYLTVAEQNRPRPRQRPQRTRSGAAVYGSSGVGSGRCGGDLPPCWVMERESKGDPGAYNPTGCGGRGCYGKWQCDPRSCNGTGTEAEQDAEAARLWDNGAGCGNWAACG